MSQVQRLAGKALAIQPQKCVTCHCSSTFVPIQERVCLNDTRSQKRRLMDQIRVIIYREVKLYSPFEPHRVFFIG